MDISVVIVSYNGRDYLRRCLGSLREHTRGLEYEVVVVDNASLDGTADMVAQEFPFVRLLRQPGNAGLSPALNQGIGLTSGELVVLLNPDTELQDNAFEAMARHLRDHPDIGVLGPKILDDDGSLQLSCRRFPTFSVAFFNRYSLLTRFLPRNPFSTHYLMTAFDHSHPAEVDWLSLACWMVPRRLFDEVGFLDEGYFLYSEDVDFCQRVHRGGRKVVYFPDVSLVHHIGGSTSTLPNRSVIERYRSMWRYYAKYMRRGVLLDGLVLGGITFRCAYTLAFNNLRRLLRKS
jgi:N-acetylglucosaminyl-diphospho-decaprenol L-rhamnosyltransferase